MLHARSLPPVVPLALLAASLATAQQTPSHAKPSAAIPARNIEIHFDPASTQIRFKVGNLLRDVRGTFQFKGGALAIDPDSTLAQGELLVDATTVHTGNAGRDKEMWMTGAGGSKQVLDAIKKGSSDDNGSVANPDKIISMTLP